MKLHVTAQARPTEWNAGHERAVRFSYRMTASADLMAEVDERMNSLARHEADLAGGDFSDGDAGQLQGGIAYERRHIELILQELEARERARVHGYHETDYAEGDLPERFAAARTIDSAEVIRALTGQDGTRSGERWRFACPFHADDTPSLIAYSGEKGWYCFSCQRGGDAVRFVAEWHAVGAVEALRLLEAGVFGARVPA